MERFFDVAVIGGGPAGSTVASLLSQKGYSVVLFEKANFPRFHIGESLNPMILRVLDKLGCSRAAETAGFVIKPGAIADISGDECYLNFAGGWRFNPKPFSYQVHRAIFDKILLDNAIRLGVQVELDTQVKNVELSTDGSQITYLAADNLPQECSCRMVVDASGQTRFLAKRLGLHIPDEKINTQAFYGHYRGVRREPAPYEGYIRVSMFKNGWTWLLPLANDTMSIGIVINNINLGPKPGESKPIYMQRMLASLPHVSERFHSAELITSVYSTGKLSYDSLHYSGDGFVLVGDAAFFLDPVFSTGVYIGMRSAELAAQSIHLAFTKGDLSSEAFIQYEQKMRRYKRAVSSAVYCFYAGLQHEALVRFVVKSWQITQGRFLLMKMFQDFGNGLFVEYKFIPWLLNGSTYAINSLSRFNHLGAKNHEQP